MEAHITGRALIGGWRGGAFSALQDEYRPDDRPDPRRRKLWNPNSARIGLSPRRGAAFRRENDGPTDEWRCRVETIKAGLPATDGIVFPRRAETSSPRHAALASRCAPVLSYLRAKEPIPSTLRMDVANDNVAASPDRAHVAGSSPEALIRASAAGKLRISNGRHEERYLVRGEGGLRLLRVRMPAGAILGEKDAPGAILGPEPNPEAMARSAGYFASLFGVDIGTVVEVDAEGNRKPRFVTAGRRKKRRVLMTQAEQSLLLQEHTAEGRIPPPTIFPPGLPTGTPKLADAFLGGWISRSKGTQAPERWQDVSDEMAREETFRAWLDALPKPSTDVMEIATTAANFREIGEAFGYSGRTAERQGKQLFLAANDNLAEILKEAA